MAKRQCNLCGEDMEHAPAIHDIILCEKTERLKGREEIKLLKQSVSFWKDAWFELREIIGRLWWEHPAIFNDDVRTIYQTTITNNKSKGT